MYPNGYDLIFKYIQQGNINTIRIIHTQRFRFGPSTTSPWLLSSVVRREMLVGASWRAGSIGCTTTGLMFRSAVLYDGVGGLFGT